MSRFWICWMILAGLFAVGCEEKTETAPAPAAPAAPSADAAKDTMKDAGKDATAAAKDAGSAASATTAPDVPAPAVPPPAEGAAAAGDKTAEAQKLLDQATTYIKENKLELADKTLTQLEGMKASLPAGWPEKIDTARKSLTAAKASGLLAK